MRSKKMVMIAIGAVAIAMAQTRPAIELERAITKEQVDGDLKAAVGAYQKIAADKSAPRDVRAKALLQLAGSYEKLGQQQARKVYEQIVRDFGDQPVATEARTRLAAIKESDRPVSPAALTQRKIETKWNLGPADTDGQRVVYRDDATGELIYSDLAGRGKRVVFKAQPDDLPGWWPSRDFSRVLLRFNARVDRPQTVLAVVNIDGTGYREIARFRHADECGSAWSWDSRHVLYCQNDAVGTRVLKIAVTDGRSVELVNSKRFAGRAVFSPDGRFVAFLSSDAGGPGASILTVPADGGETRLVYEGAGLMDWTADGRFLAIVTTHSGKSALELLPMKDGGPAGPPVFVRYGTFLRGVTAASGALVYNAVRPGGASEIHLASLDARGRLGKWERLDLSSGAAVSSAPDWSPDGNQVVYTESDMDIGRSGDRVHVRNLASGEDREIYRSPGHVDCVWAAQQPKIFCEVQTTQTDVFSIGLDSGQIERLLTFPLLDVLPLRASRDDRALYFIEDAEKTAVRRWDLTTKQATLMEPGGDTGYDETPSPDERWLVQCDEKRNLAIRPMSGGSWKVLTTMKAPGPQLEVTYDSNWVLYRDVDASGRQSLFRISTSGGTPERLGDYPNSSFSGSLRISPDGRKVMAVDWNWSTGKAFELWSVENFVPPAREQGGVK